MLPGPQLTGQNALSRAYSSTRRRSSSGDPRQRSRSTTKDQVMLEHPQRSVQADISSVVAQRTNLNLMLNSDELSQPWLQSAAPFATESSETAGENEGHSRPEQQGRKFTNRLAVDREIADVNGQHAARKGNTAVRLPNGLLSGTSSHQHLPASQATDTTRARTAPGLEPGTRSPSASRQPSEAFSFQPLNDTSRQDFTTIPHSHDRSRSHSTSVSIHSQPNTVHKFGKTPLNNATSTYHSSLGNRISTFFGQHRSSPTGSSNRPSTSQGLLEPSSVVKYKDSVAAKRNVFGIPAGKARQAPSNLVQSYRGAREDSSHSPSRFDNLLNARANSPAHDYKHQAGHDESPLEGHTTSVSRAMPDSPLQQYPYSFAHPRLPENHVRSSENTSGVASGSRSQQAITPLLSSNLPPPALDDNAADSQRRRASASMYNEKLPGNSRADWNWGVPSEGIPNVESELRMERKKQFSWVPNPSLSDGRELMGFGGDLGKKRLHVTGHHDGMGPLSNVIVPSGNGTSDNPQVPYIIGFEKQVLAFEPLIQDAYFTLSGDRHTFFPDDQPPPKRVLDIGTGTGGWPIAMAQKWRGTRFVGLDIASIQTDLRALGKAARLLRETFSDLEGCASGVDWEDLAERVTWHVGDFLQELPFDTGSFDMVHIRFVGLGVPESSWGNLFAEASRVLKRETGVLEIVEMSKILPSATPHSLKASFASLMLSNFIHQYPFIPIRPALAMSAFSVSDTLKCVLRRSDISVSDPANVLLQAMGIWVDSALGKGKHGRGRGLGNTGLSKVSGWGEGVMGEHAITQHRQHCHPQQQAGDDRLVQKSSCYGFSRSTSGLNTAPGDHRAEEDEVNLMVWLVRKK